MGDHDPAAREGAARPVRLRRPRRRRLARAARRQAAGDRSRRSRRRPAAPARRALAEEPEGGRHPRASSRSRKWPENLKAARAGKLHDLGARLVGGAARRARRACSGCTARRPAAPTCRASSCRRSTRLYERMQRIARRPGARALFLEAQAIVVAYAPYQQHVHRIYTDLTQPWLIGYRRPLFSQQLVALRRHRRRPQARRRRRHEAEAMSPPEPQILRYTRWLREQRGLDFDPTTPDGYDALWRWSCRRPAAPSGSRSGTSSTSSRRRRTRPCWSTTTMPGARWFPGAQVNYAQHVFGHADAAHAAGHPAIVFRNEAMQARGETLEIGWPELRRQVASLAARAARHGRGARRPRLRLPAQHAADGGRLPGLRQPRRGLVGVLARHGPGRRARPLPPDRAQGADRLRRLRLRRRRRTTACRCCAGWSTSCRACATWCCWRHLDAAADVAGARRAGARARTTSTTLLRRRRRRSRRAWLPFDHPLWIVYSSGTTGLPKAIVHGHGGVMLEALKIGAAQRPRAERRRPATASTGTARPAGSCGTARSTALLGGTTICLYDGSPAGPAGRRRLVDAVALRRRDRRHLLRRRRRVLRQLPEGRRRADARTATCRGCARIGATGSPLAIECYHWVWRPAAEGRRPATSG